MTGPRPPKRGAAAAGSDVEGIITTTGPSKPVVEVVRRRGPRPVEAPSAPLPPVVIAALGAIVRDMRDVPRDCIRDPAELVIWLRRMAGRVEGVGRMRVVEPLRSGNAGLDPSRSEKLKQIKAPAYDSRHAPAPTPRDLAEAVFRKGPAVARAPGPRTIVSGRGQSVRVEVRRARAAGQMELGL